MDKNWVRKEIRALKRCVSREEKIHKSISVWEEMEEDNSFKEAKIILAYWSMEDEVFTHDFVCKWASQKTFLLPCVCGEELDIRYFDGCEKLYPGEGFAILEPVGDLFTELDGIDMILVPGVAFDVLGNRLGRGKGYYDKILKKASMAYKVGVCFDFQLVEQVPIEDHDVKMDRVISSK